MTRKEFHLVCRHGRYIRLELKWGSYPGRDLLSPILSFHPPLFHAIKLRAIACSRIIRKVKRGKSHRWSTKTILLARFEGKKGKRRWKCENGSQKEFVSKKFFLLPFAAAAVSNPFLTGKERGREGEEERGGEMKGVFATPTSSTFPQKGEENLLLC